MTHQCHLRLSSSSPPACVSVSVYIAIDTTYPNTQTSFPLAALTLFLQLVYTSHTQFLLNAYNSYSLFSSFCLHHGALSAAYMKRFCVFIFSSLFFCVFLPLSHWQEWRKSSLATILFVFVFSFFSPLNCDIYIFVI